MNETLRIRTNVGQDSDKYLTLNVNQDFEFVKILSLNISQQQAYETFCADYGVVVGRVNINSNFGVPNAKVSIFIPVDNIDKNNPQILGLYPYETVNDKDVNGVRYNLLPSETDNNNECYTPVGTFPAKREVLDNPDMSYVFKKYYKFTTITNYAGDFMIFGVPLGTYTVHVDADISNIGIASQRPYDLMNQGTPKEFFYSPTKFKGGTNLNSLPQIKTANSSVNIRPFWGDVNNCQIGINRLDIDLNYNIIPSAIFMGSLFGDSEKNSVNKNCRPRKKLGELCEQETGEGTIEMIRKTLDNQIEAFNVNGGRVIDVNGVWAYQIPMNLDYVVTDEFGNLIPSKDPNKGIPTRARVRFRIGMDESGDIGRIRTRAKYLIPHNPQTTKDIDFNFDTTTNDNSFTDLFWNKIYSVKNFIPRVERSSAGNLRTFTGIKNVDHCVGDKNAFPYNRAYTKSNILYTIFCILLNVIGDLVSVLNGIIRILRKIFNIDYIKLKCSGDDSDKYYYPGSGNDDTVTKYVNCQSAQLAQQLDLFEFDFYNDWVNGALYYYLLKYKKKGNNEKFCETYCKDIPQPLNGINGTGYNDCNSLKFVDTTYVHKNDESDLDQFDSGLMVSYAGNLYYPPKVLINSSMKMFATDIICLGAVFDCDWQNYPKIIQYIPNTTYKIPPLREEFESNDPHNINSTKVNVTGMIEISDDDTGKGLFFKINCSGVDYDSNKATNIRRLSELGVDIPESLNNTISPPTSVSVNEIYNLADPNDIKISINKYLRDSFYLLNNNGSLENYPLPNTYDLTTITKGTSFAYNGFDNQEDHSDGLAYKTFRNYQSGNDLSPQAWGNSYYMYFGVTPRKTAIDILNARYFTTCQPTIKDEFNIITSITPASKLGATDAIINISFIGGMGPYTYVISGLNYISQPATTNSSITITGLVANDTPYLITVTDALNITVKKEVSIF